MDQHKKEKLELLKKELTENELKHLKNPEINPDSHILAGQRSKPLHLRTKEILSARKEKEMQTKDKIHMEKEMKDPSPNYKPNLELTKKNCFSSARKNRNRSEFLKDIDIWYKRKNEKIQTSQMNRIKEDCQKMTFHPEINKKSKKSKVIIKKF